MSSKITIGSDCWQPEGKSGSNPGVDVMITIFCDFSQFSAKKIGVFLKYQYCDHIFSKFAFVSSQKRQFFREIIWRKYFQNHNIGPSSE
jgi:hypothetical protein